MKENWYNLLHKRPPKNSALFPSIVCSLLKGLFAGVGVRVDLILQLFTAPFLLLIIPSSLVKVRIIMMISINFDYDIIYFIFR